VQPNAHDREDFDARWPSIIAAGQTAAERGARLIVLPEGTVPGYVLGNEPVDAAQLARAARDVASLARRYAAVVVYGGARIDGSRVYNAAICVGPNGDELGFAAKQFLWHFDRRWFAPGESLQPIDTPIGRLGLLVCADGRIPTIAATLVERGAQMLVMPTAWVTSGRDPHVLENLQADLLANVRARENGVPFVAANKCGVERESVAYCGKSALIDARGAFVARASETAPDVVFGDVELAPPLCDRPVRERAEPLAPVVHAQPRTHARIAFTSASDPIDLSRYRMLAAQADCDAMIVAGFDAMPDEARVDYAQVDDRAIHDPRGLVRARLDGCDFFIWNTTLADAEWVARFARTRAAELRAYVLVFVAGGRRAFAVDPDGTVIAGTFDGLRLASFVYDRAKALATTVAPTTDILAGLSFAETVGTAR
jgi:predicted amidohydrolase